MLNTLSCALSGNYVNFGVFSLYGDPVRYSYSLAMGVHAWGVTINVWGVPINAWGVTYEAWLLIVYYPRPVTRYWFVWSQQDNFLWHVVDIIFRRCRMLWTCLCNYACKSRCRTSSLMWSFLRRTMLTWKCCFEIIWTCFVGLSRLFSCSWLRPITRVYSLAVRWVEMSCVAFGWLYFSNMIAVFTDVGVHYIHIYIHNKHTHTEEFSIRKMPYAQFVFDGNRAANIGIVCKLHRPSGYIHVPQRHPRKANSAANPRTRVLRARRTAPADGHSLQHLTVYLACEPLGCHETHSESAAGTRSGVYWLSRAADFDAGSGKSGQVEGRVCTPHSRHPEVGASANMYHKYE